MLFTVILPPSPDTQPFYACQVPSVQILLPFFLTNFYDDFLWRFFMTIFMTTFYDDFLQPVYKLYKAFMLAPALWLWTQTATLTVYVVFRIHSHYNLDPDPALSGSGSWSRIRGIRNWTANILEKGSIYLINNLDKLNNNKKIMLFLNTYFCSSSTVFTTGFEILSLIFLPPGSGSRRSTLKHNRVRIQIRNTAW